MSAESKESQPSIDDILSSIREIIADDSDEKGGTEGNVPRNGETADTQPDAGEPGKPDILSVLRGGQQAETTATGENAPEPAEDVLDLSEEFIVTEATAALRREQERMAQAQPGAQTQQDESAPEEPKLDEPSATETDEEAITQADAWPQDFQMPVGEGGPTSPFTATQTHPESAWPSNDPFDVTESYKLARSQGPAARVARQAEEQEQPETPEPAEPQDQTPAEDDHADEPGIELTSFSEAQAGEAWELDAEAEAEPSLDSEMAEEPAAEEQASEQTTQTLRTFPAADELEAVFGMPPRQWAGPAQPQDTFAAEETPHVETPQEEADDGLMAGNTTGAPEDELEESHMSAVQFPAPEPEQPAETVSEARGTAAAIEDQATAHQAASAPEAAAQPPASESSEPPVASVGGKTLEDSVKELLRPMLQEWLDKNMPRLVEAAMREHVAASQGVTSDDSRPASRDEGQDDDR
ncbi:DUF2497 domain-containing protein [Dichotomicrobium thermohalophilum]|uniref:Uncharacterized protein DUF2497 n=1 Tax=Dichotomicrobium thermohalophilum TaxID=933063 RepID=A0A397PP08_9HYPH|nr:DUF2497 domain-containing protein [Dichotomicrobium thermohalophilum]RIA47471.1 uncharacterized protein DUF2497 [Dichotomicrobium thermohalophilum]